MTKSAPLSSPVIEMPEHVTHWVFTSLHTMQNEYLCYLTVVVSTAYTTKTILVVLISTTVLLVLIVADTVYNNKYWW